MALKAKISSSPNKCMTGGELRRIRKEARLSQEGLAFKMRAYGWTRKRVGEFERIGIDVKPFVMQALLDSMGAHSI